MSHEDFLAMREESMAEAAMHSGSEEMITRVLCAMAEVVTASNLLDVELPEPTINGVPIRQEREDIERNLAIAQIALRDARNAICAIKLAAARGEHAELTALLRHRVS